MRIALVAPDCNKRDGQARYVAELAEHLADRGRDVTVLSVGFDGVDRARVRHVQLAAPARLTRLRFFCMLPLAAWALRGHDFDVVHALGASCPAPNVMTFEFCQAAWDEALAQAGYRHGGGTPADRLLRRLIMAVERRTVRRSTVRRVIGVSQRVVSDVERHYRRHGGLTVIPNGVDIERFHPRLRTQAKAVRAELGVPPGRFCALLVGEFHRKNLAAALHAVARATAPNLHLVAIGGPDLDGYRRLAHELGIADRVVLWPRRDDLERIMAAADAFVFPTRYEPFGMVALEAAAVATPVITSSRCGFAEWLEDGRSGFVVEEPDDAPAIARCLDRLAASPAESARIGAAGREIAERFTWARVADQTEAVYESLGATGSDGRTPRHSRQ